VNECDNLVTTFSGNEHDLMGKQSRAASLLCWQGLEIWKRQDGGAFASRSINNIGCGLNGGWFKPPVEWIRWTLGGDVLCWLQI